MVVYIKNKLFEAYLRASQLGGDETRVALVCPSNNPDGIEKETTSLLGKTGRVKVFGQKHFDDLQGHLAEWIRSQSRID